MGCPYCGGLTMSKFTQLRLLIIVVHIIGVLGVWRFWEPVWLLLTLGSVFCFAWLGHELYCHRYLGHRAFQLHVGWQRVFATLSIFNLFGDPIGIAATHVNHHKFSDSLNDPHPAFTPIKSWLWLSPGFTTSRNTSMVKRLLRDPWLVFINKHYFKMYLLVTSVALAFDPRIVVYGFCLPVVYAFFCNSLVNVVCHRWGTRRFNTSDNSRNNHFANAVLFFSGAAMHNNHHADPANASCSRAWYEIDLIAPVISLIRTDLRTLS